MIFERGQKKNPTGNLILYCNVIGENPIPPGGKIIASNVIVSSLRQGDNFPVVTFPPVSIATIDDFKTIISDTCESCDIIRIADFNMPEEKDKADKYIQGRMEQYNQIVVKYVELCKAREKIPNKETSSGIRDYLEELTKLSLEYKSTKGIAKEAALFNVEKLIDKLSIHHPQYDIQNYRKALFYPGALGDELAGLYIKKFNAITEEEYEIASQLKKRINEIESGEEIF